MTSLQQIDTLQRPLAMASSGLLGLAVFLLVARVLLIVDRHIQTFAEEWQFEQSRRVKLRAANAAYRLTEPLVDELAETRLVQMFDLKKMAVSLSRGGCNLPWQPAEYVAISLIESLLLLLTLLFFGSGFFAGITCVAVAVVFSAVYLWTSISSLNRLATERVELFERRLPFGIDLMSLMMKAGAGFRDAMKTVVDESGEHPFTQEFKRVLDDVDRGKTLQAALGDMDQRLQSEDLREIVFSIRKSEELGTPLAEIFSTIADQLRQKKSQWAEAAAGKAQVKIQFPGLIIMLACLLTILSPFLFGLIGASAML